MPESCSRFATTNDVHSFGMLIDPGAARLELLMVEPARIPDLGEFRWGEYSSGSPREPGRLLVGRWGPFSRCFFEDSGRAGQGAIGPLILTFEDGHHERLAGLRSSRAGVVNSYSDDPIVEVVVCDRNFPGCLALRRTNGFAIDVRFARDLVAECCPGWELSERPLGGDEVSYEPRLSGRGFRHEDPAPYIARGVARFPLYPFPEQKGARRGSKLDPRQW